MKARYTITNFRDLYWSHGRWRKNLNGRKGEKYRSFGSNGKEAWREFRKCNIPGFMLIKLHKENGDLFVTNWLVEK